MTNGTDEIEKNIQDFYQWSLSLQNNRFNPQFLLYCNSHSVNNLMVVDLSTNKQKSVLFPGAVFGICSSIQHIDNDKYFSFGGYTHDNQSYSAFGGAYKITLSTSKIESLPTTTPKMMHGAALQNNKIFVFGGTKDGNLDKNIKECSTLIFKEKYGPLSVTFLSQPIMLLHLL